MKAALTLILFFITQTILGNVDYIQFEKISEYEEYFDHFDFIKENVGYYDHWQADWIYNISKESLVKGLKESYKLFTKLDSENLEIKLLPGDISHYLYNLQEDDYRLNKLMLTAGHTQLRG